MTLWTQLLDHVESLGLSGLSKAKAESAIKSLSSQLGEGFVLPNKEAQLAEVVQVPGDREAYVVFGCWENGTFDVIRQGGMFPGDVMTGWRPGQSRSIYKKALEEELGPLNLNVQRPRKKTIRPLIATPKDAPGRKKTRRKKEPKLAADSLNNG